MKLLLVAALALASPEGRPKYPLLEHTFSQSLTTDQSRALGPQAGLDRTAKVLTLDQKADIRQKLDAARVEATTPESLKEIAHGYTLLGDRDPQAAQGLLATGHRLQELEPRNPDGLVIAADGHHRLGDYEAAARSAREALELSGGKDQRALAILRLTEGRVNSPQAKVPSIVSGSSAEAETMTVLKRAITAMRAGKGQEAEAWARMAAAQSGGDPTVIKTLNLVRDMNAKRARTQTKAEPEPLPEPKTPASPEGLPLWPLGGALGLGLAGYGVYRGRRTWADQEFEPPAEEDPDSERLRQNRYRLKVAAVSMVVGFGIAYGGAPAWRLVLSLAGTTGTSAILSTSAKVSTANISNPTAQAGPSRTLTGSAAQQITKVAPVVARGPVITSPVTDRIRTLLMPNGKLIGRSGSSSEVRIVEGTTLDAETMFLRLTQGADILAHPARGAGGKFAQLPSGGQIGLRYVSKSGPPTIDVNVPGMEIKIKYLSP